MNVKGVILAAGYGTRFLPVTKTVPKEMLPLVETPSIQFIIDEFLASGIRDILIITSRRKKVLEDYFDRESEMETVFNREGAAHKLERIRPANANVFFVRQQEMGGTAHALMLCEPFTGSAPFVVAYPDDILLGTPPCSQQLIDTWRHTCTAENPQGCSILSVLDMSGDDVSRYGVVDIDVRQTVQYVRRMVEKPARGEEPSHLVSLGRYLYTPEIFPVLHDLAKKPRSGEYYQTEPINVLAARHKVACATFAGNRYDTGTPLGFLQSTVQYALSRDDLKTDFVRFLKETLSTIQEEL